MTRKQKEKRIKQLVNQMITNSSKAMKAKVDRAIRSGALNIDEWNPDHEPMIMPKIIVTALLEREATQYNGEGTCFEKVIKKEVKNLRYFL